MLNPELLFIDHQQSVELDLINFNYSLGNKGQSLIKINKKIIQVVLKLFSAYCKA